MAQRYAIWRQLLLTYMPDDTQQVDREEILRSLLEDLLIYPLED